MRLHKYSKAIMLAYGIFAAGLFATCLVIIHEVNEVLDASESLYVHPFAVTNAALEAKVAIAGIRAGIVFAVLSRDPAVVEAAAETDKSLDAQFEKDLAAIGTYYLGNVEEVARARQLNDAWKTMRRDIIETAGRGDFDRARALVLSSGTPAYNDLRATLDGITDFARNKAAFFMAQARREIGHVYTVVFATIVLGFAASFLTSLFVVRHVQRVVRSNEELLMHKANHDHLTGLPNRALFHDRLAHALEVAKREQSLLAVMFIDLDGFKAVNDTLGHEAGDELLVLAAGRLTSALRRSDTVARLGGDEFVAMIAGAHSPEEICLVADKIAARLNGQAVVKGAPIAVRGSFGVAVFPRDGGDVSTLMACADAAMYRAKPGVPGGSGAARRPLAGQPA
jgi:diguanylate cyclase (GGDEF)-like protein